MKQSNQKAQELIIHYFFRLFQGIMVATGGNDRGVTGVIPQGPQRSHVCLRVAKVVPDGEGVAFISALLEGTNIVG